MNHKKYKRVSAVMILCCMLFGMLFASIKPVTVQAKKNDNIEQLIMVGTRNVTEMYPVIQNQENHHGDVAQHQWVNNLDGVLHCISDDPQKAAKQAIVLWVGEEYLDYKETFTCADGKATSGNTVDIDGDGKPSDAIPDTAPVRVDVDGDGRPSAVVEVYPAVFNATSLGRALCGYDYEVEYWSPMVDGAGNPIWDVEPTTDPDTGIITDGVQRQELKSRTEHAKGYAELWIEKGAKVYVASLGPVSKEKGNGLNGVLDVMGDVPANQKTLKFNETLKANTPGVNYLDVYDLILDHVPYYKDASGGNTSVGGENSHYDEQTLQWIFHMLWNTILEDNPNKEPPEAIDVSLYSVSCSLTSYMNDILGVAGNETHEDHKLVEAHTDVGDAGGFLGFGDSDYNFNSFITGQFSKTSSVVDYSALLNTEPDTNNMYYYARYGRLLSDLGLDQTSTELVGIGPRAIPGVAAMLFYVLSSGLNLGFSQMLSILKLINPFQFFANTTAISASLRAEFSEGSAFAESGIGTSLLNYIGSAYKALQDMGFLVILPFGLCILIVSILFNYSKKAPDKTAAGKIYKFFLRALFIGAGVPLLGCLYTACLNNTCNIVSTTDCASTQMVASTFVNFGEWAKQFRLSTKAGNTDSGSFVLDDEAGTGNESSYKNLRHTAYQINKSTHIIESIKMDEFGEDNLKDVNDWNSHVMNLNNGSSWDGSWETVTRKFQADTSAMKQATGLIIPWLKGTFYHASDFESDTMSVFTEKHRDDVNANGESLVGRRPGLEEDDPPDNKGTLYELFENSSTATAWGGRTAEQNTKIFENKHPDDDDFVWDKFNIFANGSLKAEKHGSEISYKDPDAQQCNKTGTGSCLSATMGLSTVAMYNYLSTDFQANQMVIYSQAKAASTHTSKSHFAVNMIGSGIWNTMYYLNMVVVMLVISVLGIYYMCGMVWNNVKQTFSLLAAIPVAMLGILSSVVNVIVIVVTMMAEILGTVMIYEVISDLIGVFATLLDGGFYREYDVDTACSLIGGRFAFLSQTVTDLSGMSNVSLMLHMMIFVAAGIFITGCMIKYAKRFQEAYASACELVLIKLVNEPELWHNYNKQKEQKASARNAENQLFTGMIWDVVFAK